MKYLKDFLIGSFGFLVPTIIWHLIRLYIPFIGKGYTALKDSMPFYLRNPLRGLRTASKSVYFDDNKFLINIPPSFWILIWLVFLAIWFGLWNIVSRIISKKYGLSKHMRFFVIAIISSQIQVLLVYYFKVYKLTPKEWIAYYLSRINAYLFMGLGFYHLDKYK